MVARFARLVLIVTLVLTTGLHWAFLQSVAWTVMLADNLNHGSVAQAVERTFDGKHPCSLCKAIAAGKQSEHKAQFTVQLKKLEYTASQKSPVLGQPPRFDLISLSLILPETPAAPPPSPPPRASFA